MAYSDVYELFHNSEALPDYTKECVSEFFMRRFTGNIADLFVEMAEDLPQTFAAIQSCFSPPCIGTKPVVGHLKKKVDLLFLAEGRCLVGTPQSRLYYDLYDIDETYKALPKAIRSYYMVTDGLQMVSDSGNPGLAWTDLPLGFVGRRTLEEAAEFLNLNSDHFDGIPAPAGSRVWMMSERDLLIVDEETGTFFHSDRSQPNDLFELNDPVTVWDTYCAHTLSGASGADFDFRQM